ncbi:RHS repeat domain-containing protein, partial [Thermoactinomyces mirandus]|uniref:RHS repeat domain-containing protein n=1 Tax=Thermoactinomyces mirandus TaxID=2756294 RepID=UPI001FE45F45
QSTTYDYDELDQLVKETAPDGTITEYTYGAAGNRTPKKVTRDGTTITNTYTYDDADQLTAVNGQAYTYDENGNLTNDGSKTYAYDAENRLTQVQSGSETVQFAYRADSMRTRMTTNAGTTYFQYDENKNVSIETNASGQVIASLYL